MARPRTAETLVAVALAAGLAAAPILLFHQAPVAFAHLIAEDFAGEYATSAAFAVAGLIFLADALRAPLRSRRLVGLALGLAAILVAGEEVSWGERQLHHLFGLEVSASVAAVNLQGEMNLHNLELLAPAVSSTGQALGSALLLAWRIASGLVFARQPDAAGRLRAAGVPLVPPRLAPLCCLAPLFFVVAPVAKADEVGELMLGVAALAFALDWSPDLVPRLRRPLRPLALPACLAMVAVLAVGLGALSPLGRMAWRLHTLAERDYPAYGLYPPANALFGYIYAHPDELMDPHSRLGHAEVLLASGAPEEARRMVDQALAEDAGEAATGDFLRRAGRVYQRLGEDRQAERAFAAALGADRRRLAGATDPDRRARLLFSLARTLAEQGRTPEAESAAVAAAELAVGAGIRSEIQRWLEQTPSGGSHATRGSDRVDRL